MLIKEENPLINYDELYSILYAKFMATHDEIRYWIKKSINLPRNPLRLEANVSDIPFNGDIDKMYCEHLNEEYDHPLFPPFHFYSRSDAENFIPSPCARFVYIKDLTAKRNWYDFKIDNSRCKIRETLKKANEVGILRFYDFDRDEFTLHKINKPYGREEDKKMLWGISFDGEKYLNNPDSFFLLYDILTVERVFFNKPREECLKELGDIRGYENPIYDPSCLGVAR